MTYSWQQDDPLAGFGRSEFRTHEAEEWDSRDQQQFHHLSMHPVEDVSRSLSRYNNPSAHDYDDQGLSAEDDYLYQQERLAREQRWHSQQQQQQPPPQRSDANQPASYSRAQERPRSDAIEHSGNIPVSAPRQDTARMQQLLEAMQKQCDQTVRVLHQKASALKEELGNWKQRYERSEAENHRLRARLEVERENTIRIEEQTQRIISQQQRAVDLLQQRLDDAQGRLATFEREDDRLSSDEYDGMYSGRRRSPGATSARRRFGSVSPSVGMRRSMSAVVPRRRNPLLAEAEDDLDAVRDAGRKGGKNSNDADISDRIVLPPALRLGSIKRAGSGRQHSASSSAFRSAVNLQSPYDEDVDEGSTSRSGDEEGLETAAQQTHQKKQDHQQRDVTPTTILMETTDDECNANVVDATNVDIASSPSTPRSTSALERLMEEGSEEERRRESAQREQSINHLNSEPKTPKTQRTPQKALLGAALSPRQVKPSTPTSCSRPLGSLRIPSSNASPTSPSPAKPVKAVGGTPKTATTAVAKKPLQAPGKSAMAKSVAGPQKRTSSKPTAVANGKSPLKPLPL